MVAEYPGALLARVKARYEGRDGVGEDEGGRLVVDSMAQEFGVHANSIFGWARRFKWRRPDWYRARRPARKPAERKLSHLLPARLLAVLQQTAAAEAPCPTNAELALRLCCSGRGVVVALQALVAAGEVASEVDGPRRRLTLKDGARTDWTPPVLERRVRPTPEPAGAVLSAGERRSRQSEQAVLAALRAAADQGRPFPSDAVIGAAAGVRRRSVLSVLKRLEAAGAVAIERAPNKRRGTVADGAVLGWTATAVAGRGNLPDLAAIEAVRALRRMGKHVFDVAVVTGRAWGVTWSVDGRLYGRDALIAYSRERRAVAMERMGAGA